MELIQIIKLEVGGKQIEFSDKPTAEETVAILTVVDRFIPEDQKAAAARAVKKYVETLRGVQDPKSDIPTTIHVEKRKKAPEEDAGEPEKPAAAPAKDAPKKRNILPNPPGFVRDLDPSTGQPKRGRAPNDEKVGWAQLNATAPGVAEWAADNNVTLPATPSEKPTPPATPPAGPPPADKPPALPAAGDGPPPAPPIVGGPPPTA